MRKSILFFCIFLGVNLYSQNIKTLNNKNNYEPGQLIVKFKDSYVLNNSQLGKGKTGVTKSFDDFSGRRKVLKVERVFEKDGFFSRNARRRGDFSKYENITIVTMSKKTDNVDSLIKELKGLPEVEFAEPNYIFSTDNAMKPNPVSISPLKIEQPNFYKSIVDNTALKSSSTMYLAINPPSDPLYTQQSNLQLINAQKAWEITKGDSSVVIGVIDTGVDWLHPDLTNNIWVNKAELNGLPGVDDDRNGYIDDIRGWDFVNNDNNPTDDNSHGTHVAGIISARGDNGLGITGVNWYAKIMSIKVMQSTGRGDAVTIAKGVEYAASMGANIINLSLGGYYESLSLKSALEKAYANCFIVAAAGNNGTCIGPGIGCAPMYPGAYSFVMGVQDQALYSNYDQDGPFASKYYDLLNYDTYAPGTSILSTIPNGTYASYTGTSMSTPTVAGIASLYMSKNKIYDKELLFTNLVQMQTNGYVDAYRVLTEIPKPDLRVAKYEIVDTANGSNNNGRPDAGESINLRIYLKNYSGKADSVSLKLSYEGLADTSLVSFLQDSCYVGSISPNTVTFSQTALNIKISNKVAHGADYKINIRIKDNKGNIWKEQIVIVFQNAITLGGIITSDMTLYPNKYYNVTDNVILNGCKLIIKPGSTLNFSQGKALRTNNNGVVIAIGKKDSVITFTSNSSWLGMQFQNSGPYDSSPMIDSLLKKDYLNIIDTIKNYTICKYCIVENVGEAIVGNATLSGGFYINTIFRNNFLFYTLGSNANGAVEPIIISSNFLNNKTSMIWSFSSSFKAFNNHMNNFPYDNFNPDGRWSVGGININSNTIYNKYSINVFNNKAFDVLSGYGSSTVNIPTNIYFGTTDSLQISKNIYDYFDNTNFSALIIKDYKTTPCDFCPGIVWKLTIDNKEFSSISAKPEDILEIGTHQIKVWFNRQMDTTVTPNITFGQRDPYNQIAFKNKGVWALDRKSYTISREFVLTDPNGIVNFSVTGAKDDMGMEIPYERTRFRINLQSSASKSLNFGIIPQCGKLHLNWDNLKTAGSDIIGYNIYRRTKNSNNGGFSLLNSNLVLENLYKDYKVSLDSTYEYVYTAVRSGMNSETDSSFILSGKPLPSKLGDANGDSLVNVSDVVTTVNYILNKNPAAFIFKQTDLNNDGVINVLDVIGVIDRILNPRIGSNSIQYDYNKSTSPGKIFLYNQNDTLFAKTVFKVGGIQSEVSNTAQSWLGDLAKWESIQSNDGIIIRYAFDKTLHGQTPIPLAKIGTNTNPSNWIFSTDDGRPLEVSWLGKLPINFNQQSTNMFLSEVSPNPVNGYIRFTTETKAKIDDLKFSLNDISGSTVLVKEIGGRDPGINNEVINVQNLIKSVYFFRISWKENGQYYEKVTKLILQ